MGLYLPFPMDEQPQESIPEDLFPEPEATANETPAGKPSKMTVRRMFVDRMGREGRGKEFAEAVKKVMQETGSRYSPAAWEAMRRLGYAGPEKEKALYHAHLMSVVAPDIQAAEQRLSAAQDLDEFERAVRLLSEKASVTVEIAWIRAHPAMSRAARANKNIELTAEDILHAPHGPAPSQGAARDLQYWCNHQPKFYEMLMSEQKKQTEQDEARRNTIRDTGLDEVEQLLLEVRGG